MTIYFAFGLEVPFETVHSIQEGAISSNAYIFFNYSWRPTFDQQSQLTIISFFQVLHILVSDICYGAEGGWTRCELVVPAFIGVYRGGDNSGGRETGRRTL